jgi:hypothetical protein
MFNENDADMDADPVANETENVDKDGIKVSCSYNGYRQ